MTTALPTFELPASAQVVEPLEKQPYRLFFPLGVMLGWVGVGQWLLFSLGLSPAWRSGFHAMLQVQGFIGCFIAGFLFTFIPRRTMGRTPSRWQLVWCAACPVALAFFAWNEAWVAAQLCWVAEGVVLLQFVASRARENQNPRPTPPTLIWVPVGLALSLAGTVVSALPGQHAIGKMLVLEGLPASLVMGIGAMLVPVITRAQPPPNEASGVGSRLLQIVLAAAFVASFWWEGRGGYAIRLFVSLMVLVRGAQLWRMPTQGGLNRRLVWVAAWCLPLGYTILTAWPAQRTAGLHIIFLGGFGLLSLTVGHHVIAAHGGRPEVLKRWPWSGLALALLTALALGARLAVAFDPTHMLVWLTIGSIAFLAAGGAWLVGIWSFLSGAFHRRPANVREQPGP